MSALQVEPPMGGLPVPHLAEEAVRGLQPGSRIMPIYIVLDHSASMGDVEDLLNQVADELIELAKTEPEVADVAYVCVIGFNESAQVLVPLGDIREARFPRISTGGGTNYTAVLELVARTIEADTARLAAAKAKVFRSLVWFLTDGEPQDSAWEATFRRLFDYNEESGQGNVLYPRFVPLGFRQANPEILAKMAYPPKDGLAYLSRPGTNPTDAFKALVAFICKTTVASGLTVPNAAAAAHVFPTDPSLAPAPSQYAAGSWVVP